MKNFFFLLSLTIPMLVMGRLSSSEIEFKNGPSFFKVSKSETKFIFTDHLGTRSLDIKNCNEKVVDQFWSDLVHNIENLKNPGPSKKNIPAWVQYDKVKSRVPASEPAMNFFSKIPASSQTLFAESKRLCKDKL